MAIIRINDLKVNAFIGAYAWERKSKQELFLNITIEYEASQACSTDKLKDALDYAAIASRVKMMVERSKYVLLEKLASKILSSIMSEKRVVSASVRVDKPLAVVDAKSVSFEVSATR
ncbi:MAG: dihydroneopterin aldolase [Candidatus Omnitrophica bacterium]|nr:dihydroneopterin aldolase [Candidatus Omnitrophota bacterium]